MIPRCARGDRVMGDRRRSLVLPVTHHPLLHDSQLAGCFIQATAAIHGADDGVFDPYPELTREVDPWFIAEDHTLRQRKGVSFHQVRLLVEREPQSMPGTMDEGVTVTGRGKDAPRGTIDLLAGHPGTHCLERGLVSGEDRLVGTGELG